MNVITRRRITGYKIPDRIRNDLYTNLNKASVIAIPFSLNWSYACCIRNTPGFPMFPR